MATLYENYYSASGLTTPVTSTTWYAQGFTPSTSHYITSLSLFMSKSGTPSSVTVSIRATSGEVPTGGDLVSANFTVADIPDSGSGADWVTVAITATSLTAATKYAIVLRTGSAIVNWGYTGPDPAGTYSGGQMSNSINSGSTWTDGLIYTDYDMHFREYGAVAPTVVTQTCETVANTTAGGRGNITSLGGGTVTAHGHCWATTTNPTTSSSKDDNGAASATGTFKASITGLTAGTGYYTRAFATNEAGTSYGDNVYFVASTERAGTLWIESDSIHFFDASAIERIASGGTVTGLASFYHHGNIDGGDMDTCSPAMDALDVSLDGGTF